VLDILITNATLITMEGRGLGIIENGSVGIRGNKIAVVGRTDEIRRNHDAHRVIDATGKAVMPGLIDAHFHSAIAILRGVAQDINNWLQEGIWPFIKAMGKEESVRGSLVNIIEGVKAGTTTFCDFDYYMNDIVQNHIKVGSRARVAETVNEIQDRIDSFAPGELYEFNSSVGEEKLQNNIRLIEEFHGAHDGRITCLFGPQAADMVSAELLLEIRELAEKYETMIYMHVAQGDRELNQMLKRYGKRSVPHLDDMGYLDEKLIAVHLYEATPDETTLVAQRGCSLIVCSGSIGLVRGMVPPLTDFLRHSEKAGLGTDQAPGNNCSNMFNEMKLTALFNKCKAKDPTVMPAWQVMKLATIGAARAIGMEREIGSIKEGKKADIIIIDLEQPNLCPVITEPVRNIVPNLVYAASGREVETVIIDGRVVMEDREMKTVDEKQAIREAQKAADELAKRVCKTAPKIHSSLLRMMEEGNL